MIASATAARFFKRQVRAKLSMVRLAPPAGASCGSRRVGEQSRARDQCRRGHVGGMSTVALIATELLREGNGRKGPTSDIRATRKVLMTRRLRRDIVLTLPGEGTPLESGAPNLGSPRFVLDPTRKQ
jgi:hypothetical protein